MSKGGLSALHLVKLNLLVRQIELVAVLDALLLRLQLQQVLRFQPAHLLLDQLAPRLLVPVVV